MPETFGDERDFEPGGVFYDGPDWAYDPDEPPPKPAVHPSPTRRRGEATSRPLQWSDIEEEI